MSNYIQRIFGGISSKNTRRAIDAIILFKKIGLIEN